MKKLIYSVIVLLLAQCGYGAALFDNFESYLLEDIFGNPVSIRPAEEATGMIWNDSLSGVDITYVQISVDPFSSSNQTIRGCTYRDDHKFFSLTDPGAGPRPKAAHAVLPTDLQIGPSDKKTVFFRVYRQTNRMGLGYVGLAEDSYQPSGNDVNMYAPFWPAEPNYCANFCVPLRIWSHTSSYPEITVSYGEDSKAWIKDHRLTDVRPADPNIRLPKDTWFNVWMIIDNATEKVDIYIKSASGPADNSNLLVAGADFLNPVTEANGLTKFVVASPFGSTSGEIKPWIYVDDIYVFDGNMLVNPKEAIAPYNPTPAYGAKDQPLSITFKWDTAIEIEPNGTSRTEPNVTGHYIYYAANSTNYGPYFVDATDGNPEPNASYGPVSFNYDDVVTWHVEEQIDGSSAGAGKNIVGPIWSFDVFKNIPTIVRGPWDKAANVGDSVVFTVDACDPAGATTLQYQWFQGISGDTSNPVTSQATSPDYTTDPIIVSDFNSYYWCQVTSRAALNSSAAQLVEKKILAKWTLDAIGTPINAIDVTGNGYGGTITAGTGNIADVTVVPGKIINAYDFNEGKYVVIDKKMARPNLFTVTAWIKIRNLNYGDSTVFGWNIPSGSSSNRASLYVESAAGATYPIGVVRFSQYIPTAIDVSQGPNGNVRVDDGNWHFVAATFDNGWTSIYVDGVIDVNSSITNYNDWPADTNMCIGTSLIKDANSRFDGAIDDVRLYSYPLDKSEIAAIYLETEPFVCTASKAADLNGDCDINFKDFAIFAQNWLVTVDYLDLSVLTQEWLDCKRYATTDPPCPGLVLP